MTERSVAAIHPATPAQQGLVLGSLVSPTDALFVEQIVVPLDGELDPEQFDAAVAALVARHEILRTAVIWDLADAPKQVVFKEGAIRVPVEHHAAAGSSLPGIADRIIAAHREQPFDPARPPLLRLALLTGDRGEHLLVWTNHHLILDGWSQFAAIHELLDIYAGVAVPAPTPFGVYAKWLTTLDRRPDDQFWMDRFRGHVQLAPLVARPVTEVPRFGTREWSGDSALEGGLHHAAELAGVTVATVVTAAWLAATSALAGTDDVVIGVTSAGRPAALEHATEMIGPFAVTLPLRAVVPRSRFIARWLADLGDDVIELVSHDKGAPVDLAEVIGHRPDWPLYDSIIAFGNYPLRRKQVDAEEGASRLSARLTSATAYGGRTGAALTLVAYQLDERRFRLVNDRTRVPDEVADAVVAMMVEILRSAASWDKNTLVCQAIPDGALQPLPRASASAEPASTTAEFGFAGVVVANIFRELFGLASVHVDDDFLQIGGHSLLAVRLLERLRRTFSVDLTMSDILRARTPRGMARRVREMLGGAQVEMEQLPPVVARPEEAGEPFPMTRIQQAYWVGRQPGFDLNGVDSHLYGEVDVQGLDLGRFEFAWSSLIRRHGMLRAVAKTDGRMQVLPHVPEFRVPVTDLRDDRRPDEGSQAIRHRLSHMRRDTRKWPLFTIEAALLPDGVTRLFLSFDLLIGDAQSWRILYRELVALYDQPEQPLADLEISFRDYALALSALDESVGYRKARQYWRERLESLPPPPELPMLTQADKDTYRFVRRALKFSAGDVARLQRCSADLGVTVSVLLLGVFAQVLGHYTASKRFLINVTVFNRIPLHPDVDNLVGDFTSLLPEAVDLSGTSTLAEQARRLQHQMWADLDHRLYSGLEVLRDIGERDGQRTAAMAPVVFTSTIEGSLVASGNDRPLRGEVVYSIGQTPQVLLDYQTYLVDGELVINWDSIDAFFPAGYLSSMFAAHEDVLTRLIRDPDTVHGELVLAPDPSPASEPVPTSYQLLHEPFLDQARRLPDEVAIVAPNRSLTYCEVLAQSADLAERIRAAGGDGLVMIHMEKSWEQIVAAIAVLLAGRAFLPTDASWPASRVESHADFGGCDIVLTQPKLAERCHFHEDVDVISVEYSAAAPDAPAVPANAATATDIAYVIFTSGSTGRPKGVMIEHGAALNTVLDINARFDIGPADSVLAVSSLAFDLAIYDIFGLLAAGGRVIVPAESQRRDPGDWLTLIRHARITIWNSVPVLMDLLTSHMAAAGNEGFGSLRLCMLSGDWIPLHLPEKVRLHFPQATVVSLGGATEGSIWSIMYEIGTVDPEWRSIPYGHAMTGQGMHVLSSDLTPLPAWVPGELYISGAGLARGYWRAPELTDAAFLTHPRTGIRLYRTGDWGRMLPDGTIEFLGRRDGQVKIGGYRVELGEIERAAGSLDGVGRMVAVAPGHGIERRLVGFFVGRANESEVGAGLKALLPAYMVPTRLVRMDDLPVTPTGKIDRSALLAQAGKAETGPAPVYDVDADLAAVVATFVGSDVAPDLDLLQFGMNSIDVIRLCNVMESKFGVRPNIEAFYQDPTMRGLARLLQNRAAPSDATIAAVDTDAGSWSKVTRIEDPGEREAFLAGLLRALPGAGLALLPGAQPLDELRRSQRRTHRSFSDEPVTIEQLDGLLDCLRRVEIDGRERYLYPSAGAVYGVRAYLYAAPGRIVGLREGLYYYDPVNHDLVAMALDLRLSTSLHKGHTNQEAADTSAFTIFLVADPQEYGPLYGSESRHLAILDAGYIGQLLCESARPLELALCPLHGYRFEKLRWLFHAGDRASLLHLLAGGRPGRALHPVEEQ